VQKLEGASGCSTLLKKTGGNEVCKRRSWGEEDKRGPFDWTQGLVGPGGWAYSTREMPNDRTRSQERPISEEK